MVLATIRNLQRLTLHIRLVLLSLCLVPQYKLKVFFYPASDLMTPASSLNLRFFIVLQKKMCQLKTIRFHLEKLKSCKKSNLILQVCTPIPEDVESDREDAEDDNDGNGNEAGDGDEVLNVVPAL